MRMQAYRAAALGLCVAALPAAAQTVISANESKMTLDNGVPKVVPNPSGDTVTVMRFAKGGVQVTGQIAVPTSLVGPPVSVAVSRSEKLALVTAAMQIDPADPAKQVPGRRVSVIDLTQTPPKVVQTVEAGAGAAGVSFTPDDRMALVADRSAGTVSVFKVDGMTLTKVDTVAIGKPEIGVSHVAVTPDGRRALVTRDGDSTISVLKIDNGKVEYTKRDLGAGLRPYGLSISPAGDVAVVANLGRGGGDADTVSLIDLAREPYRVVDTVTVGQTPEGIAISPNGRLVAAVVIDGSNKPKGSPFYAPAGKVVLLQVKDKRLVRISEAPIGTWSQGAAFSADSRTLLVGNIMERNIQVFRIERNKLVDTRQPIALPGGSAALRTADFPPEGRPVAAGRGRERPGRG
ncbi:beta-propeller fold lactonase family protein [Stella sp.]|uniref:YncE family protein n=1 Tax=Stella sp. TaxID=2912054 RepID=UPI0035AF5B55